MSDKAKGVFVFEHGFLLMGFTSVARGAGDGSFGEEGVGG